MRKKVNIIFVQTEQKPKQLRNEEHKRAVQLNKPY